MKSMRPFTWITALAFAAVLSGCVPKYQHVKFVGRPKAVQNAVSLSPSTSEIMANSAYQVPLKGRTASDNYPISVLKIPVVASVKPDYEKLKQIQPDFIIYDRSLYNDQDIAKIKELGADMFVIDANTVDDFEKELYELANKIGNESSFATYIDRIESAKTTAEGDTITPKPKVAVIMTGGGAEDSVSGTKSFIADVVKIAGGEPVGPDADRFVNMNAEQMAALNPDVIFVPTDKDNAAKAVASLLNDPRLRSVNAVKNKKLVALDQDVVLRRGARVEKLIDNIHRALSKLK